MKENGPSENGNDDGWLNDESFVIHLMFDK